MPSKTEKTLVTLLGLHLRAGLPLPLGLALLLRAVAGRALQHRGDVRPSARAVDGLRELQLLAVRRGPRALLLLAAEERLEARVNDLLVVALAHERGHERPVPETALRRGVHEKRVSGRVPRHLTICSTPSTKTFQQLSFN